jgi:predicted Rossmann fold nucleotide-binding protein DprA/Smf involved in DNA uptake
MPQTDLNPQTEITLLLCGGFSATRRDEPATPLNVREFTTLSAALESHGFSLLDLLDPVRQGDIRSDSAGAQLLTPRIETLLARGTTLAMAVERWSSLGLWVIDRTDDRYPNRFHHHLGSSAPPLLYGAGDLELLRRDQLRVAVVGSREIDNAGESFARNVGIASAEISALTVSGGARGADRTAIDQALENGGEAIAILPGALQQVATSRAYRSAVSEGQLTLLSPYHPGAKFTAGNAMGRNRLIYCLADLAIVVESALGTGGTWSGATEALTTRWVPVAVRREADPSPGNAALIAKGGLPIEPDILTDPARFSDWLTRAIDDHEADNQKRQQQLGLFG